MMLHKTPQLGVVAPHLAVKGITTTPWISRPWEGILRRLIFFRLEAGLVGEVNVKPLCE
jgi:hypothetical protein